MCASVMWTVQLPNQSRRYFGRRTAPSAVLSVRSDSNGKVLVNVVASDRPATESSAASGITAMQIGAASNFAQAPWQNYSAQATVDISTRSVTDERQLCPIQRQSRQRKSD
jgi:hypothetical protein